MADYWYVRAPPPAAVFHLVEQNPRERWGAWREQPMVRVLYGATLVNTRTDGTWEAQVEGDMLGWPMGPAYLRKVDATQATSARTPEACR